MKWILRVFLVWFCLFVFTPKISAGNEFETTYAVRCEVLPSGKIVTSQNISLTNKLSNIYATEYTLFLKDIDIENIEATDGQGPIKTEVTKKDETTIIKLNFNQQVVGTNKTLSFQLKYDSLGLAQRNGQVWEINIPGLSAENPPDNYSLTLAVPIKFGSLALIRPLPVEQLTEGEFNLFRFTKNQILTSKVNAIFGQFQVFDFNLTYYLENPNSFPAESEIALPPDGSFQQLSFRLINPLPENVYVDGDGNWLARYRLEGKQKLKIVASGKVKIFATPQEKFVWSTPEQLNKNLSAKKYWEVDHPLIQEKAGSLKTAKDVYELVVKTLNYDFNRVKEGSERLGALGALANPNRTICMEFTDLFVALARAAGIPARGIDGFAYTDNPKLRFLSSTTDVLHSWPEYWDKEKKVWIQIDPTWEKTTEGVDYFSKTDLSHFAFAIHGQSSETPYPAGSYKIKDVPTKDVEVNFGIYEGDQEPKIEVDFSFPKITIKNRGPTAVYNLGINITAENLSLVESESLPTNIPVLPPFGKQTIEIKARAKNLFTHNQGVIKVLINKERFDYPVKISFPWWVIIVPIILTIILFCVKKIRKQ